MKWILDNAGQIALVAAASYLAFIVALLVLS